MSRLPYALMFQAAVMLSAGGFAGRPAHAAGPDEARFYVVDVGHGNAVFAVAPSGEVMLMDTGARFATDRVLAFMSQNGIAKIDYLLISHFHDDHIAFLGQ